MPARSTRPIKQEADGADGGGSPFAEWLRKWWLGVLVSLAVMATVGFLIWSRDVVVDLIVKHHLEGHPAAGGRAPGAPEVIQPKVGLEYDDYAWHGDLRGDDDEADAVFEFILLHRVKGPGDYLLVWTQGAANPVRWEIEETGHPTQVQLHCAAQQAVVGTMTREFPGRTLGTENDIYVRIQVSAYLSGEPILLTAAK